MSKTIKIIISYEQNIYKDLSTMSFEFMAKTTQRNPLATLQMI